MGLNFENLYGHNTIGFTDPSVLVMTSTVTAAESRSCIGRLRSSEF
jgi:hypothetical protein